MQNREQDSLNDISEHEREIESISEKFRERIKKLEHEKLELKLDNEKLTDRNERLTKQLRRYQQLNKDSEFVLQFRGTGGESSQNQTDSSRASAPSLRTGTPTVITRGASRQKNALTDTRPGTSSEALQANERDGLDTVPLHESNQETTKPLHGKVASNKRKCKCGEEFRNHYQLTQHISAKFRGYIRCDFEDCNEKFALAHLAERHKNKVHGGHKPFACGTCKRFFDTKHAKQEHQQIYGCHTKHVRSQQGFESIREPDPEPFSLNLEDSDSSEH